MMAGQMSRLFLATFCDLQYELLFANDSADFSEDKFQNAVTEAATLFRQLLNSSTMGDGLLCKLVTIAAFSEWHTAAQQQNNSSSAAAARNATLVWGTCLAERVVSLLEGKQKNKSKMASVRVLMPVLLLTEFVLSREQQEPKDDQNLARDFWKAVVCIYNLLQQSSADATDLAAPGVAQQQLKEHQMLRGFAPFASFLPPSNGKVYLSDAEAVELLQHDNSSTSTSSQQSALSSSLSSSNQNEGRLKVQRFLGLPLASSVEQIQSLFDGRLEWVEPPLTNNNFYPFFDYSNNVDYSNDNNDDAMMGDDNDQGNILVYQQADGGPALLVPGALLQQNAPPAAASATAPSTTPPPPPPTGPVTSVDSLLNSMQPQQQQQAQSPKDPLASLLQQEPVHPPTLQQLQRDLAPIMPPPGFGGDDERSFPMVPPPPPGADLMNSRLDFTSFSSSQHPARTATFGESFDLFGGAPPTTSNPFASNINTAFGIGSYATNRDSAFLASEDSLEGTTLLDSGLLNSLLMGGESPARKNTKNPFAT